jgi:hypothetical protein
MANLQAKDGAGTSIFIKATGTGTNADPFSTESRTNVLNFPASQPVTDVNIGTTTDTAATTDTGTFSLIALVKRLLGKLPTLVSERFPVDGSGVTQPISATTLPLPTGAAVDTTLQAVRDRMPATLGAQPSAQSLAVTLSTDGAFATAFGAAADAAATTDTANTGFISLVKRILGKLPSALVNGRFVVDGSGVTQPVAQISNAATTTTAFTAATTSSAFSIVNRLALITCPIITGAPTLTLQVSLDGGTTWVNTTVTLASSATLSTVIEADSLARVSGALGLANAFRFSSTASITATLNVRSVTQ